MGDNAFINSAIPFKPETKSNGDHQRTIAEIMLDAGVDALNNGSTPEEVSGAVIKFSNLTISLNPVLRGAAKSDLIKKLKKIGITGASDLVRQATHVPGESNGSGQEVAFNDPNPWAEEITAGELLEEIKDTLKTYTVIPEGASTAIALWCLFGWCHNSFYVSPILCFSSPTKRCGKSTALRIISKLVPRPLMASNISTAALFRSVEHFQPTLILDELDTFLNSNPEINGIINAGHDRDGAFVLRVDGDELEPKQFSVWCPKVFAGIGRRKDTLEDRSIIIPMKRKSPTEKVKKIRLDRMDGLKMFCQKAKRWADDYSDVLRLIDPVVLESLDDRAQDNWRPLMAIADIAGGDWPEKANEAALLLSGGTDQDDDSVPAQLLTDIRDIFYARQVDRLSSEDLTRELIEMEDRPWPEYRKGKPISKTGVARILKPFGIKPKTIRLESGRTPRGYLFDQFKETFLNYLPDRAVLSATPQQTFDIDCLVDSQCATSLDTVAPTKDERSFKINDVAGVADEKGSIEGEKEKSEFRFEGELL